MNSELIQLCELTELQEFLEMAERILTRLGRSEKSKVIVNIESRKCFAHHLLIEVPHSDLSHT